MGLILALSIFGSLTLTSVSANATIDSKESILIDADFVISGDSGNDKRVTLDEQLTEIATAKSFGTEAKMKAVAKIDFVKQLELADMGQSIQTKAAVLNVYNCTRSIPYYKQETTYYCGPATTKQSLQYLKGSSPTQSSIASSLGTTREGTDGTKIVKYLNSNQNSNYYVIVVPTSQSSMESTTYSGLTIYNAPPILRLSMTTGQGWPYPSSGHFMNISGQYTVSSNVEYQVTDPYINWKAPSNTSGKYRINSSAVYQSTRNHFAQHFYY